jgi:hypothetical protein
MQQLQLKAITRNTMAWTLEAKFALAALLLTFIMSEVGLLLKHRRCMPYLKNSKDSLHQKPVEGIYELALANHPLTQLDPESGTQHYLPSELQWVDIADVRRYQQATYTSMVRFRQRQVIPTRTSTH